MRAGLVGPVADADGGKRIDSHGRAVDDRGENGAAANNALGTPRVGE
jgi:hypothetical protein